MYDFPNEDPKTDPLDLSRGLKQLATFIKSAGFPEAAFLIWLAALSTRDGIDHALDTQKRTKKDS